MDQPKLGYTIILNNLAWMLPETVQEVEELKGVLEEIGFKSQQGSRVKVYNNCNMRVLYDVSYFDCFILSDP